MSRYFERRRWPRLSLGLVMVCTGASGFGVSFVLLKLGMTAMWQRYPLAVLGAYAVFLILLRVWVEIERMHFNPEDPEVLEMLGEGAKEESYPPESKKNSWLDGLDVPDIGDVDSLEGCAFGAMVLAAIAVVVILITTVAGAPVLIGEVAVDVFLVSMLYRRLKEAEREHWLSAAVRQTWLSMLATAALLAIIGICLEMLAPGSVSISDAIRHWRGL